MNSQADSGHVQSVSIDMRDPAFRHDPHPMLRNLRESGRLARDVVGVWLITHHEDANTALRSRELSREFWRLPFYQKYRPFLADSTLERIVEQWMLFTDPPTHTRLRNLVNDAFKPRVVEALRERIERLADELLGKLPTGNALEPSFDLMSGLAQPLPVRVICDLMGLPFDDFGQTKQWVDALAVVLEPVIHQEQRLAANKAAEEMVAYLRNEIAVRRKQRPRDDLLGALLAAHEQSTNSLDSGPNFSEDEVLGNLILLFIAGHETTTNLIGNGVLTLLQHPSEMNRLRADPTIAPIAVEEILRYEGSVAMINRFTVEPYAVGETVIPVGQTLMFLFSPINRDPAVFADPERFDVTRSHNPHLSFGAGVHFCLGARLARLEGEIAFNRLLARFPRLTLTDPVPRWRKLINLRGLEILILRDAA
ncbi:cytochrome P450 [Variovorax ureilyticus]|uniref:Cytochrome P450 n=1 Tax=Variovorax ureilyticus TaxID=1836198 RepID=A0ABU8VR63_9BURK